MFWGLRGPTLERGVCEPQTREHSRGWLHGATAATCCAFVAVYEAEGLSQVLPLIHTTAASQSTNQSNNTSYCTFFNTPAGCKKGAKCKHTHPHKLCTRFASKGHCSFGTKCHFSHKGGATAAPSKKAHRPGANGASSTSGSKKKSVPRPPAAKAPPCSICHEPCSKGGVAASACGHSACVECVRRFYAVEAPKDLRNYPLKCFMHGCSTAVTNKALKDHKILRGPAEWQRHHRFTTLACGRDDPTQRVVHCPLASCDTPILVPNRGKGWRTITCRNKGCGRAFDVAPPAQDINETANQKATFWYLFNAHKEVDSAGGDDGWRRCPSCKFVISKGDGCDCMSCVCGHVFCWQCKADWSTGKHRRSCEHYSDSGEGPGMHWAH